MSIWYGISEKSKMHLKIKNPIRIPVREPSESWEGNIVYLFKNNIDYNL